MLFLHTPESLDSSIFDAKLGVSMLSQRYFKKKFKYMLFLPTPGSADLPIVCAKLGVFMPSQKHFK